MGALAPGGRPGRGDGGAEVGIVGAGFGGVGNAAVALEIRRHPEDELGERGGPRSPASTWRRT